VTISPAGPPILFVHGCIALLNDLLPLEGIIVNDVLEMSTKVIGFFGKHIELCVPLRY
jgi:hypothetical protein